MAETTEPGCGGRSISACVPDTSTYGLTSAPEAAFIAAASWVSLGSTRPGFFGALTSTTRLPLAHSLATLLTSSSVMAGTKRWTRPYS